MASSGRQVELLQLPICRCHVMFKTILVFFSCTISVLIVTRHKTQTKEALLEQVAELEMKVQRLDMKYREKKRDAQVLNQHLSNLLSDYDNFHLSTRARDLLKNASQKLEVPSVFDFQPHLLLDPSSLQPAIELSKGRSGVSMVLGIPTVKREAQSYLVRTLRNIISNMNEAEQDDTIIVVMIAETAMENVHSMVSDIKLNFGNKLNSGLVEVITPPASFYPEAAQLHRTLGDPIDRVWWRSKQNLDFAFLMSYSMPKAVFYVQLEDDVISTPQFVTLMKNAALTRDTENKPWFALNFCSLGFIGKMFRCSDLPWLIQFLLMFYNDKPCDWLLYHLIQTKFCALDQDTDDCRKSGNKLWVEYEPSLFQHIGTHSSLKGKMQNLQVIGWPTKGSG